MSSLIVANVATETGHWYTQDGAPAYTMTGANGKVRNTTLRDAKKFGLLPSVTTIIRCGAQPGLERWKQEQVLLSALTMPRIEGEDEQSYMARILEDSKMQGKAAAEEGERIHAAIERYYKGVDPVNEYSKHVYGVVDAIGEGFNAERSFASRHGFGGKVDLSSDEWIWDVKTKEFSDPATVRGFDDHLMQVAAYRVGLQVPGTCKCGNIFVSRTVPGLVAKVEWSQEDLTRGWQMFKALLDFWKAKNRHGDQT
jgi:hypothetical protein